VVIKYGNQISRIRINIARPDIEEMKYAKPLILDFDRKRYTEMHGIQNKK
jgi:hypothetical protein